ncbi:MAG TPA: hypothetical protein VGS41_08650 [Chthonomonadales bacterium]|nr:hypothetical protein [Chthonomonadales bacterium]
MKLRNLCTLALAATSLGLVRPATAQVRGNLPQVSRPPVFIRPPVFRQPILPGVSSGISRNVGGVPLFNPFVGAMSSFPNNFNGMQTFTGALPFGFVNPFNTGANLAYGPMNPLDAGFGINQNPTLGATGMFPFAGASTLNGIAGFGGFNGFGGFVSPVAPGFTNGFNGVTNGVTNNAPRMNVGVIRRPVSPPVIKPFMRITVSPPPAPARKVIPFHGRRVRRR